MAITASEIASRIEGVVLGEGNTQLTGFAPASTAKAGDLTFAENETFFKQAEQSAASAIMVDKDFTSTRKVIVKVKNARIAFAKVLTVFFPEPVFHGGIHATAVIAPSAQVDPSAHIGPHCVVGERTVIGPRSVLQSQVHIGADCRIGEDSHIFPLVALYSRTIVGNRVRIHSGTVIGADGFGYVFDSGIHRKIPQVGWVSIQDDVEIGANVAVDRGALGPTTLGRGTKVDNLVQIAHNVSIGENSLLVAQAGIAGSTKLGQFVTIAGQVGVAGHLKIGNQVTVAAQSGVMHDIPDGQKWFGSPAQPDRIMKRQLLATHALPDLMKRVAQLERELQRLQGPPSGYSNVRREEPAAMARPNNLNQD